VFDVLRLVAEYLPFSKPYRKKSGRVKHGHLDGQMSPEITGSPKHV
jgi:hypothetical protein